MKKYLFLFLISICITSVIPININAGQKTDELGICLTDSLTGKERKMLMKWLFFAMSAHPELSPYLNVADTKIDDINKHIGQLLTRLIADDCPQQTLAALKENGNKAMESAFDLVGRVAMQELMTDQNVAKSMLDFEKYLDKERLQSLNKK